MKSCKESKPALKWLIFFLCAAAAGVSLWLTVEKLSGRISNLAGCGSGSGCANVLGSKWSVVFGVVPVSLFSLMLYVGVALSFRVRADRGRLLRLLAAWMCIWAALWFTGLQLFELKSVCPYCMGMHGLGVAIGLSLMIFEGLGGRRGLGVSLAGLVVVAGLALIQHLGPDLETHRVDVVDVPAGHSMNDSGGVHSEGEGRLVTFLDGSKSYRVGELPHLGSADAKHVVVKYFDYTCDACRQVDAYLSDYVEARPGELAVIVLPVPLQRECNSHLPPGLPDHENACNLARLALKVWFADSSKFSEFHHQLFELKGMPIEMAESLALGLVGDEKMSAVDDARVECLLQENVVDYGMLSAETPVMPKLLLRDSVVVQGLVKDQKSLEALLDKHLGKD